MTEKGLKDLQELNEFQLTPEEEKCMTGIFEMMGQQEAVLNDFDTKDVEIMVHVQPMTNMLREDKREQPFSRESLLDGAPEHTEDSWQVPRLVK